MIIMQKVYLLRLMPVCFGLIMLAAYFCHSCYSYVEYNACIALRVIGAVLVVFLRRWRKSSNQWEERVDTWRNLPNPADQ
jgi:hypothetical protein